MATGCPFCQKVHAMFRAAISDTAQAETVFDKASSEETHAETKTPGEQNETKLQ